MKKKITLCEIEYAKYNYIAATTSFDTATANLYKGISSLIEMLNNYDKSLLKINTPISIPYIDGEDLTNYEAKSVEIEEDGSIIIKTEDEYGDDYYFDFYDLEVTVISTLGQVLYEQFVESNNVKS